MNDDGPNANRRILKMGGDTPEVIAPNPEAPQAPQAPQAPVKSPLRLKRKEPEATPAQDPSEPLVLNKPPTNALDPEEILPEFENSVNGDLLRLGESLAPKLRWIIAALAVLFVIIGFFISAKTIVPALAYSLVSFSVILLLSRMPAFMKKFGMPGTRIVLFLVFVFSSFGLCLSSSKFISGLKTYTHNLNYVIYYFEKGKSKSGEIVDEAHTKIDSEVKSTNESPIEKTSSVDQTINPRVEEIASQLKEVRFIFWLQILFFVLGLMGLSLLIAKNFKDLKPVTIADQEKFNWQISAWCLGRFMRAPVIALCFLVGLSAAGYDTAFFISFAVFLISYLLPFGAVAGLLLALPMMAKVFYDGGAGTQVAIVAATTLLAILLELKFNWLLAPVKFLKKGWLPLILFVDKKVRKMQTETSGFSVIPVIRGIWSLSMYTGIFFVAWRGYEVFNKYNAEKESRGKHVKEFKQVTDQSFDELAKMYEQTGERELLLAMSQSKLVSKDLKMATKLAEDFKDWQATGESKAVTTQGYMQQLDQFLYGLLPPNDTKVYRGFEAYEFIMRHHDEYITKAYKSNEIKLTAQAMLELNEKDEVAMAELVFHYYYLGDLEESNKWADKIYNNNTASCLRSFAIYAQETDNSTVASRSSIKIGDMLFDEEAKYLTEGKQKVYAQYILDVKAQERSATVQ
jgi:predicted PurR-regulated permease PerM